MIVTNQKVIWIFCSSHDNGNKEFFKTSLNDQYAVTFINIVPKRRTTKVHKRVESRKSIKINKQLNDAIHVEITKNWKKKILKKKKHRKHF